MPVTGGGSSAVLKRSAQVCGVVEAADDPAVRRHHEMRDGRVVGAGEREPARARRDVHGLADHAAVDDRHHDLVGMVAGDALDRAPDAARNSSSGSAPGMTSHRRPRHRAPPIGSSSVTRWRHSPPSHSPRNTSRSSGSTCGSMPEPLGERRRRLMGAPQRRHVDRGDPLAGRGQSVGDLLRLRPPFGRQLGVAVPVDQR